MPLAVIARTHRYPLRRVVRLSLLAGVAHVAFSLLLGAVIIVVGLQFRSTVERNENLIVGGLLIVTGLVFAVLDVLGHGHGGHSHSHDDGSHHHHGPTGHSHEHHEGDHDHRGGGRTTRLLAFVIPFGAAASPDLTILPVFLAASALGVTATAGSLIAFSLATIATIVGLTMIGAVAGYQMRGAWIDRGANMITAAVLLVIGVLVAVGVL